MGRLNAIEGLRGYLATWVLIGHVMAYAGYQTGHLSGFAWLLRENDYAVDIFVIVSGFVIFLLLDTKRESYKEFICRRFFRLYPVFIILFLISIPVSQMDVWNLQHSQQYLSSFSSGFFLNELNNAWQHRWWNIFWHLGMLHGLVPDPNHAKVTDTAFLGPAWSVSLEWQFYLIAPVAFWAATSPKPLHRIGVCVFCMYLFLGKMFLPVDLSAGYAQHGAFLPFHVEFFFLGAVFYFLFKNVQRLISDVPFAIATCAAVFLWQAGGEPFVPFCLWLMFAGLLLEPPISHSSKILLPLFINPVVQFLGRISYSIYLSHALVLTAAQFALLNLVPHLNRTAYFWALLAGTFTVTIALSSLLYRFVEKPGIEFGKRLASRHRAAVKMVQAINA